MKQTLRNLINSRIPSLLELKFGCEVLSTDFGTKYKIISKCYGGWDVTKGGCSSMLNDYLFENGSVEILGTPPSWGEYLRCLGDYAIDGFGYVMISMGSTEGTEETDGETLDCYDNLFQVDLSKSPLEQTDEITQKMIDLISNTKYA